MSETQDSFMLEAIKVIANETRESFKAGFDKALEFYKVMTQPPPAAQTQILNLNHQVMDEDEADNPAFIDVNSIWNMTPEMREAVLANYGLQVAKPAPAPVDPTHETMRAAIAEGGLEPPPPLIEAVDEDD